ncbi:hypothetical protein MOQ72_42145 [Saccharopolyspora sp. K220]|uniref:hypothetical protein n=1 Tax=Saccharopolyspora soli TaxID=2926618 RepID=UPI001F592E77|nr:hypothetical protein [Saccharopolyspora soli]MCI2424022.1 hypothetical protein [Saccharopolyspora soli]
MTPNRHQHLVRLVTVAPDAVTSRASEPDRRRTVGRRSLTQEVPGSLGRLPTVLVRAS